MNQAGTKDLSNYFAVWNYTECSDIIKNMTEWEQWAETNYIFSHILLQSQEKESAQERAKEIFSYENFQSYHVAFFLLLTNKNKKYNFFLNKNIINSLVVLQSPFLIKNVFSWYHNLGLYSSVISYWNKILPLYANNDELIANIAHMVGDSFYKSGSIKKALKIYRKDKDIKKKQDTIKNNCIQLWFTTTQISEVEPIIDYLTIFAMQQQYTVENMNNMIHEIKSKQTESIVYSYLLALCFEKLSNSEHVIDEVQDYYRNKYVVLLEKVISTHPLKEILKILVEIFLFVECDMAKADYYIKKIPVANAEYREFSYKYLVKKKAFNELKIFFGEYNDIFKEKEWVLDNFGGEIIDFLSQHRRELSHWYGKVIEILLKRNPYFALSKLHKQSLNKLLTHFSLEITQKVIKEWSKNQWNGNILIATYEQYSLSKSLYWLHAVTEKLCNALKHYEANEYEIFFDYKEWMVWELYKNYKTLWNYQQSLVWLMKYIRINFYIVSDEVREEKKVLQKNVL